MKQLILGLTLCVRSIVRLIPLAFRKRLRQNTNLLGIYSGLLHASGLFYGEPSKKQTHKRYQKIIHAQGLILNRLAEDKTIPLKINIIVHIQPFEAFSQITIDALKQCRYLDRVFLTLDKSHGKTKHAFDRIPLRIRYIDDFAEQDFSQACLCINNGDAIHCDAVVGFTQDLQAAPSEIIYCDIDQLNNAGERYNPKMFPDWDPDLQFCSAYIRTGVFVKPSLVLEDLVSFLKRNKAHSNISVFICECYLHDKQIKIGHLPLTLVHQSNNKNNQRTKWPQDLSYFHNSNEIGVSKTEQDELAKIIWVNQKSITPLVSIIIPTKNAHQLVKTCITSILQLTTYSNYEILLVDNNSDEIESLEYFHKLEQATSKLRLLRYPKVFNYSAINNFAVEHANGELIALVNNDVEVISPDWLSEMVMHANRDDIGCVGAKLLYPSNKVQHAGVVIGYGGGAGHAHKYYPDYHPGYLNRLKVTNAYSAVTAACLLVKKSTFWAVKGLNEENLAVAFNDVDFCLKVKSLGLRNLFCAEAILYHHESISRGLDNTEQKQKRFEAELSYIQQKWQKFITEDPCYNRNLSLRRENFALKEIES